MTSVAIDPGASVLGGISDPPILAGSRRSWTAWLGPAASIAILLVVLREMGRQRLGLDIAQLPHSVTFWAAFVLYNLASPIGDWVIFRKLWSIPISGIGALLRKHVTNRLLFGYLGEVYFYSWARQNGRLSAAPFGAIKDVAILSAVCSNVVALAILPFGMSLLHAVLIHRHPLLLGVSVLAFSAITLVPIVLGRRIFSLNMADLGFVALAQGLRAIAGILLYAVAWHAMVPAASFQWWIVLAALRQTVTRLPFVPDDEIVFTALAVFFLGRDSEIAGLVALLGSVSMAITLALGLLMGLTGLRLKEHTA